MNEEELFCKLFPDYVVNNKPLSPYFDLFESGFEQAENCVEKLQEENAELRKVAEFQQSSNMNTHFENKKLKEGLTVGSMWNKHLNSQNKALEEERDRYRNMTFDQREHLTKAKEIIKKIEKIFYSGENAVKRLSKISDILAEAEQFLKESEVEK